MGQLPTQVIRAVVESSRGRFRECHDSGLKRDPTLGGIVKVRFTISPAGRVSYAAASDDTTLNDALVVACMVGVFKKLVFPKPDGGSVKVIYPLKFVAHPVE